uniref:Organic cation/carnitine transporter 7 n=1 Tax=Tanacetum cinerariifolium TaxID=118510 RepID=A0A699HDW4_TANCI|nr:organic cation/carnitine transporter 7 [Tanacetum cinerariifolium]
MAEKSPPEYTVNEALMAIGNGKFQINMFLYAVLGSMAEAMELTLLTYIRLAVEADLQLTSSEENLISIVTYVGIILGAWIWSAGIMERYGWRLLLGVSSLSSLVALLFYTLVPESPRFLYAKGELGKASKILNWGAEPNKRQLPEGNSEKGAQNERKVVTSEEDEIKDVTLDIDKRVACEIQIDEAHHTLKKDDPVDRAGPKVEQGNPKNEKEDEINEKTKLIIRHNNTHKTSRAIFGILDDGDIRTKNVHGNNARLGIHWTLGAGVAIVVGRIGSIVLPLVGEGMISYDGNKMSTMIMFVIVVGRIGSIVLPLVGEGMISYDGNKTPAMIMFAFKISVYGMCSDPSD